MSSPVSLPAVVAAAAAAATATATATATAAARRALPLRAAFGATSKS